MGGGGVKVCIEVSNDLIVNKYVDLVSNGTKYWDDGSVDVRGGGIKLRIEVSNDLILIRYDTSIWFRMQLCIGTMGVLMWEVVV